MPNCRRLDIPVSANPLLDGRAFYNAKMTFDLSDFLA
jgi:hypothetical protein